MTPIKLTLEGFTGVHHGLGKDALTIDLSGYQGLVAVTGENGKGKTTLLDNLQPYRLMPSKVDARRSGYSPAAFSYYDHTGTKARKELTWSHGDVLYKSEIVIKASATGKTKSTEAYLFVDRLSGADGERGEWAPYKLEDGTESDGKNEVYDRCVVEVLGSPDAFFTSAFASQGRAPLCDYRNADIKDLLSEMLNLGRIRDLGERAATVRTQIRSALTPLKDAANRAADLDDDIAGNQKDLEEAEAHLGVFKKNVEHQKLAVKDAEIALAEEKRLEGSLSSLLKQELQLKSDIAELEQKEKKVVLEARDEEADEARARDKGIEALQAKMREARRAYQDIAGKVKTIRGLVSRENEIRAQASEHREAVEALEAVDRKYDEAQAKKELVVQSKTALREIEGRFNEAKQEGSHKSSALEDLRSRAVLVDNVPCVGTPMNDECKLLENARTAREQAASVEVELQDIRKRCVDLKEERENFIKAHDIGDFEPVQAAVVELSRERERLRVDIQARAEAGRLLAELEAKKEGLADLEASAKKADDEISEIDQSISDLTTRCQQTIDKIRARAKTAAAELEAQREKAAKALVELEIPNVDVKAKEAVLEGATFELAKRETKRDECVQEIANRKAVIEQRKKDREKLEEASRKHRGLTDELSVWEQLAKALGNDGIIALSIDDAGPTISGICNDLLRECYGPRFTVGIRTQAETAKGTAKETFDIRVFDAQADEEKSIRLTSGGEGLWLNEALTRSIALFQAEQSGRAYETLFADESDGALDVKKKVEFIRMKRAVLELGGYKREYFITHTPELWELADHVIDVGGL